MSQSILKRLAASALLSFGALAAQAQGGPMGGMDGHGGPGGPGGMPGREHMMMMHHELKAAGATEAQMAQIKAIFKQAMIDEKPAFESLRALHKQGEALFAAPVVDASAVMALHTQAQTQHDAIGTRMARALIDASAVLSPEQRAKIFAMQQKHEARMAEHMKEHGKDKTN